MKLLKGCLAAIGCLVLLVAAFILIPVIFSPSGSTSRGSGSGDGGSASISRTEAASKALAYLGTEVDELAWYEVDGNEVFIGFNPIPSDVGLVTHFAAMNGNKAIGFGFHAWAVDARKADKGWRPGDPGGICEVSVRHGKVESNSCPRSE